MNKTKLSDSVTQESSNAASWTLMHDRLAQSDALQAFDLWLHNELLTLVDAHSAFASKSAAHHRSLDL